MYSLEQIVWMNSPESLKERKAMTKEQKVYNKTKGECDRILRQIGVSWDDLPDTNSIWDWIDEDMSDSDIQNVAKDCCWDRLYDGGMDRDLATETIYGKEAV